MIYLNPFTTALVLIDLQEGIVGSPLAPHTGSDVVRVGVDLARRFRAAGSPVPRGQRRLRDGSGGCPPPSGRSSEADPTGRISRRFQRPGGNGLAEPSDLRITKRQWGAFYGTDLDLQLRPAGGIRTIVLGGVSTNIGVESTARQAYEHGYEVVIAEDATTSRSVEMHAFSVGEILPLLARVSPFFGDRTAARLKGRYRRRPAFVAAPAVQPAVAMGPVAGRFRRSARSCSGWQGYRRR